MSGLKRNLGLGLLTFYGVGVMVGAGIYVLTGTIAGVAGAYAPIAFLLAGLVAAPTALTYGELSSRIPESAGEAAYMRKAFGSEMVALLTGALIIMAGTVSAGAVLQGGVGYLGALVDVPRDLMIVLVGVALVLVACLGIVASLSFAAILTAIEILGLVLVVWAGVSIAPEAVIVLQKPATLPVEAIAFAAVLAFFAFIGFEDMVNLAEETINPGRTMPIAIIIALTITTSLYALVVWAAIRVVSTEALGQSRQPLALVYETATGEAAWFLSLIAVFAALNGVLAQLIMAARVLFGLGRRFSPLAMFHQAHARFGTPVRATLLIGAAIITAGLFLDLETLAETTSILLLVVFCAMNAALIALKLRKTEQPAFQVPFAVPVIGLVFAVAALMVALLGG